MNIDGWKHCLAYRNGVANKCNSTRVQRAIARNAKRLNVATVRVAGVVDTLRAGAADVTDDEIVFSLDSLNRATRRIDQ